MSTEIVVIAKDELLEAIDLAVSKAIERVTKIHEKEAEKDKLMSLEELQEYLPKHKSKSTIYQWTCSRKIPFKKVGRELCFLKSEIDDWLDNKKQIMGQAIKLGSK